jgi:hypothetical protein
MVLHSDTAAQADKALKDKHRAMWARGNYPAVAAEIIPDLGAVLVSAVGVSAGDRVLDVAAGSGNAAIPAALAGATVVACDLTPELLGRVESWPRRRARGYGGNKLTRRHCPIRTPSSTQCCHVSGSCSHPITRSAPMSWFGYAAPVARSV